MIGQTESLAATLWLVRHARPLIQAGVCYGALDVPADPQATLTAAQELALQLPQQAQLQSSPLQRCELLAKTICGLRPDLVYKTDVRLAEMNFGCWEGQRWDSIAPAAYAAWTDDFWQHRFGAGESVAAFMKRVAQAWSEAQAPTAAGRAQVWVTHAGVIRAVNLLARGVTEIHQADQWPTDTVAFGSLWCVRTSPVPSL